jgi:prepilin-type processing-associated H-X9-DG protein
LRKAHTSVVRNSHEDRRQSLHSKSIRAFTLIELLVTIACVVLVLTLLLWGLPTARRPPPSVYCVINLKQIGLSFRTWALDNDGLFPMRESITNGGTMELVSSGSVSPHFQVMSNELSTPRILVCPNDTHRTYATNFGSDLNDTKLSYFINVDSVEGNGSSLLCGDRNLTNKAPAGRRFVCLSGPPAIGWTREIHEKKGNLCFADGSVNGFRNGAVDSAVHIPDSLTNRLAVP